MMLIICVFDLAVLTIVVLHDGGRVRDALKVIGTAAGLFALLLIWAAQGGFPWFFSWVVLFVVTAVLLLVAGLDSGDSSREESSKGGGRGGGYTGSFPGPGFGTDDRPGGPYNPY